MHALVVYESLYGNTAAVAEAIGASLGEHGLDVEVRPVSGVDPVETGEVGLLVLGGPTHVHGLSRASTRKVAVDDEKNTFATPTVEPGLRDWVKKLPSGEGRLAAAFDTRIDKPAVITGSAAKGIARKLKGHGFRLVVEPGSFLVSGENRLLEGEVDRATTWAADIAGHVVANRTMSHA